MPIALEPFSRPLSPLARLKKQHRSIWPIYHSYSHLNLALKIKRLWFFKKKNLFMTLGNGWVFQHRHLCRERAQNSWVKLLLRQTDPQSFNFQYFKCFEVLSLLNTNNQTTGLWRGGENNMGTPASWGQFLFYRPGLSQLSATRKNFHHLFYFPNFLLLTLPQGHLNSLYAYLLSTHSDRHHAKCWWYRDE